jgi:hypothetical protein
MLIAQAMQHASPLITSRHNTLLLLSGDGNPGHADVALHNKSYDDLYVPFTITKRHDLKAARHCVGSMLAARVAMCLSCAHIQGQRLHNDYSDLHSLGQHICSDQHKNCGRTFRMEARTDCLRSTCDMDSVCMENCMQHSSSACKDETAVHC